MKKKIVSKILLILVVLVVGFNISPAKAEAVVGLVSWGIDRTGDKLITPGTNDKIGISWGIGPDFGVYEKHVQVYADGVLTFDYVGSKKLVGYDWFNTNHLGTHNEIHVWYLEKQNCYNLVEFTLPLPTNPYGYVRIESTIVYPPISATVDITPDTLYLMSERQWITAYIQLPEGYNAEYIDAATILLNETIQPVLDPKYKFVTNSNEYLVDHNEDGILERMVKFDRAEVMALLSVGEATLTITGEANGTKFECSDSIRVILPSRSF